MAYHRVMAVPLPRRLAAAALMAALLSGGAAAAAEIALRAASSLPGALPFGKQFVAFTRDVNKRGKGLVRIDILGDASQRTAPLSSNAVRSGLIDMAFGPAAAHAAIVPEVAALLGSNVKAAEMRRSGAMALMGQIYRNRMNAHFLGALNTGVRMHLYLSKAPRLIDGHPQLTGFRIRTEPMFREFIAALDGEPITGAAGDDSSGDADGMTFPRIGLARRGDDGKPTYRIDPGFSRLASVVVVNIDAWSRLPRKARALLTETMAEHEGKSYITLRALAEQEEEEALEKGTLRVITLKGTARKIYLGVMAHTVRARLDQTDPAYRAHLELLLLNK